MEDGYRLSFKSGDYRAEIKFKEEVDLTELSMYLESFLSACTWLPKQVRQVIKRIN